MDASKTHRLNVRHLKMKFTLGEISHSTIGYLYSVVECVGYTIRLVATKQTLSSQADYSVSLKLGDSVK